MLQDAHSRKIKEPITAPAGDTLLIARNPEAWNYIHEIIGDLSAAGTVTILGIDSDAVEEIMATFTLADGQGLTLQDEPGEDNRPRFEFRPDQDAVMRTTGGTFIGAMDRSIRL